jgi:hypothetical protein
LEQDPSFRVGQEFYARFNENHPDIGYLDLNSPFIIEDILNSIELLEDSLINLDTGSTQELDNIIIGGATSTTVLNKRVPPLIGV